MRPDPVRGQGTRREPQVGRQQRKIAKPERPQRPRGDNVARAPGPAGRRERPRLVAVVEHRRRRLPAGEDAAAGAEGVVEREQRAAGPRSAQVDGSVPRTGGGAGPAGSRAAAERRGRAAAGEHGHGRRSCRQVAGYWSRVVPGGHVTAECDQYSTFESSRRWYFFFARSKMMINFAVVLRCHITHILNVCQNGQLLD